MNEVGMELENQEFDRWLAWSEAEVLAKEQKSAAFSGTAPIVDEEVDPSLVEDNLDEPDQLDEPQPVFVRPDQEPYETERRPLS